MERFLPIYAWLEHIPRNLVEASHDLGATPGQTFWRVILPLSIPGLLAGAAFAFVLSLFSRAAAAWWAERHHDLEHRRQPVWGGI